VTVGLNVLQAYLERTQPQVAGLVRVLYAVEQEYRYVPKAGYAKKQAALRKLRG
jgi:hypothetical protein